MQQRFDRWPRSARIEETSGQIVDHFLVGHLLLAVQERSDVVQANGGELLRHDRLHVAAAALDEHGLEAIAKEIDSGRFDAIVTAAPEDERLLFADQPRLNYELLDWRFRGFHPSVAHPRMLYIINRGWRWPGWPCT